MHISGLKESKFLKRQDCGAGILVTINRCEELNVAKEGAEKEYRWCLWFDECDKPMVLNSTNGQIIAQICASEETDDWHGHKIVLYDDPTVSFGGKLVGGIRARAPRGQAAKPVASGTPTPTRQPEPKKPVFKDPQAQQAQAGAPNEDDVPF